MTQAPISDADRSMVQMIAALILSPAVPSAKELAAQRIANYAAAAVADERAIRQESALVAQRRMINDSDRIRRAVKRDQIDAVSGAYKFLLGKGRGSMRDLVTE